MNYLTDVDDCDGWMVFLKGCYPWFKMKWKSGNPQLRKK